jgi:hypothetical protein
MAALSALPSVEGANLVWQRVNEVLVGASPASKYVFNGLKKWLSTQKGNPQLRFTAISAELLLTANDGLGVGAGTALIYGLYLKKRSTNGTDAFVTVLDDGTDDNIYAGSLTGSYVLSQPFLLASDESCYVNVNGLTIANGIRIASLTTLVGTTATTLAATTCDGFMISA